ncbi:DegT/DnrJ/EryC1/StrS family aminotransferase [Flavobacteriales bacterium AH-315-E23]|nr:DegT/DnrJ/EryC1/StrS family aminotransferase [Flavobacteriales bacterium AH-315-E23]
MLPFYKPSYDPATAEALKEVLKSGWMTTGPKTKEFEKQLTAYCGNQSTICVSAATTGLELMLRWFGVREGDEVILPAYTYAATANVIIHCGAKPVFVDSGQDFNISVEAVEKAITSQTKVIMPVDFAGLPCDYDALNDLVRRNDIVEVFSGNNEVQNKLGRILILSDAAHSVGASYKGRKTGSLTDISVFSFHAVKNLTTGEGGAIALNLEEPFDNEEIYDYLNINSLHGQTKDALAKTKKGEWRYDINNAGYKCNMTDLQAAIGIVELAKYESVTLVRRKEIFDHYSNALSQYDWAELPEYDSEDRVSSFHVYPLRIVGIDEAQRDGIIDEIFAREVSVNVHYQPVPMMSYYKKLGYSGADYPVAFDNYSREITLPVYIDLTNDDLNTVIDAMVESVKA